MSAGVLLFLGKHDPLKQTCQPKPSLDFGPVRGHFMSASELKPTFCSVRSPRKYD